MVRTKNLSKKDLTKNGLKKIINRDITELNAVSDRDLLSVWSFFKFLVTQNDDKEINFVTPDDSIIARYGAVLSKNTGIRIMLMNELMNHVHKYDIEDDQWASRRFCKCGDYIDLSGHDGN